VAILGVFTERHSFGFAEKRLVFKVGVSDLGQPVDRVVVGVCEAGEFVASLGSLKVEHVRSQLVTRSVILAAVDEAAQVVLRSRLE